MATAYSIEQVYNRLRILVFVLFSFAFYLYFVEGLREARDSKVIGIV
jgi:hypothetical protein